MKFEITNSSIQIKADNPEIGSEGEGKLTAIFVSRDGAENFDKNPFCGLHSTQVISLMLFRRWRLDEINISFGQFVKAAIATLQSSLRTKIS